jgi:hypothetical protein
LIGAVVLTLLSALVFFVLRTRLRKQVFQMSLKDLEKDKGGKLEVAQQIADHESPRTTKLYDCRQDEISLDEIERITI